jgi:signal transduction histidine kinase
VAPPLGLAILAVMVLSTSVARLIVRSADRLERALAAARAADDSKTEFLSTVSHELRTPMNGIMGVAQLLELTRLDQEQRELVNVLTASARTQMSLISDLLDLARIESGHVVLASEPFAPGPVLREIVELVRTAAQAKRVAVESDIDALRGVQLLGDERAFRQVATNFLGNAVKFTEQGKVRLQAGVKLGDATAAVEVRVSDTGPGIAPDDLVRIFERFMRCNSSRARHEGTGLGLAISRQLADLMGGTIGVESTLGTGSTFTFRVSLPLVGAPAREVEAA